jgi:ferredoxin
MINQVILYISIFSLLLISKSHGFLRVPTSISRHFQISARDWNAPVQSEVADLEDNGLAYEVVMPLQAGIDWGTDLSFRWVYVTGLDPAGEAAASGMIQKGDYIIGVNNQSVIGADFDTVLSELTSQGTAGKFQYTFFRGTKEQLIGGEVVDPRDTTVTVTVREEGKPDRQLTCKGGTNLRNLLVGEGINVYRSLTRWTNCNGNQRCGTCIVDITEGFDACSRKDLAEEAVLAENPDGYRLSCVTAVYGDITVVVQSPVGAAQWTR